MEVHDSAYLRLCVENLATFAPGALVEASARMRRAADPGPAAAFAAKLGRLEPYCRDEAALRGLRKALGEKPFLGLLEGLRQENYHMIAGGLMHEGRHAGLDGALIASLRADFEAGRTAVQWDEVLAFAGEAGYHLACVRWGAAEVAAAWSRAEGRLGELERLRKKSRLDRGPGRTRFENARASAWAAAALVRLRMREIWQSARRAQDLAAGLRRDYVREAAPPDAAAALAGFEKESAAFAAAAGEAIQRTELALRALEALLDTWGDWADGRRPFPPPVTDSRAVMAQARSVRLPEPAGEAARALRELAAAALERARRPG